MQGSLECSELCEMSHDEQIEFFCNKCKIYVCGDCAITFHDEHFDEMSSLTAILQNKFSLYTDLSKKCELLCKNKINIDETKSEIYRKLDEVYNRFLGDIMAYKEVFIQKNFDRFYSLYGKESNILNEGTSKLKYSLEKNLEETRKLIDMKNITHLQNMFKLKDPDALNLQLQRILTEKAELQKFQELKIMYKFNGNNIEKMFELPSIESLRMKVLSISKNATPRKLRNPFIENFSFMSMKKGRGNSIGRKASKGYTSGRENLNHSTDIFGIDDDLNTTVSNVPFCHNNTLYNFTLEGKKLKSYLSFPNSSPSFCLHKHRIYTAGGDIPGEGGHASVYQINVKTYIYSRLPSLIRGRYNLSLIYARGSLYALGGFASKSLSFCEKLKLEDTEILREEDKSESTPEITHPPNSHTQPLWTLLPPLTEPRDSFGSCLFADKYIYTFGGGSFLVEKLDLEKEERWEVVVIETKDYWNNTFGVFPVSIDLHKILVFGGGKTYEFDPITLEVQVQGDMICKDGVYPCFSFPVKGENYIFLYGNDKKIHAFELSTAIWKVVAHLKI